MKVSFLRNFERLLLGDIPYDSSDREVHHHGQDHSGGGEGFWDYLIVDSTARRPR